MIWGNPVTVSNACSSLSFWYSHYIITSFAVFPQLLIVFVFCLFSLWFSSLGVSTEIPSGSDSFLIYVQSTNEPIMVFFISVLLEISSISFWFSENLHLSAYHAHLFFHVAYLIHK